GNGTQWSVVPSPNVGSNRNYLRWVAQAGPNDVWAVGTYWNAANVQQTLTLHWDGRAWSVVPSPNNGTHENYLNGVTAAASNDVWAVGLYSPDMVAYQTLIEHWDGSAWSVVNSPNAGIRENYLNGVATISSKALWAVGYSSNTGSGQLTLIEQFVGQA